MAVAQAKLDDPFYLRISDLQFKVSPTAQEKIFNFKTDKWIGKEVTSQCFEKLEPVSGVYSAKQQQSLDDLKVL